jgi:ERCC4-type nuclease
MTVIITTNEPKEVKELFVDRLEMALGFDLLLYTKRGPFPMERKKIPGDLISSVLDGRLQRELIAMREINPDLYGLILHGEFKFKGNDLIMTDVPIRTRKKLRTWTKKGIRNLLRSLELMEGCVIIRAKDDQELVDVVNEWQDYLDADLHRSVRGRPRIDYDKNTPIKVERVRYFYAGLPCSDGSRMRSLGIERAKDLQEKYPSPIDLYKASCEDIMKINGFGKSISENIYNFLRGIC